MAEITYRNRRAYAIDNEHLQIVVTVEGGHIAAIIDKSTDINPLWSPPWPSIEPSTYDARKHAEYGDPIEGKLLSGLLGHNLCLDLFGAPSPDEAAAGLSVHGESSVAPYRITVSGDTLTQHAVLDTCQLAVTRTIQLAAGSRIAVITETVENLSICDRPVAWTQHVTLGPPFLEKGVTRFDSTATRSLTAAGGFAPGMEYMQPATEFEWPYVPCIDGGTENMRVFTSRPHSGAFSTHLMDPKRPAAWFAAHNPNSKLAIAYVWKQSDLPWMGIWEENYGRNAAPWNGRTLTRGMEFGASPFPESRKEMIERGSLFGLPGYKWIPARQSVTVEYKAIVMPCEMIDDLPLA